MCHRTRNRVGNPTFCLLSQIPTFVRGQALFLALGNNGKVIQLHGRNRISLIDLQLPTSHAREI